MKSRSGRSSNMLVSLAEPYERHMNHHGITVTIDEANLASNFAYIERLCPRARVAAVVKADAYGCGVPLVVPALERAGCSTFFVAHLQEAERLRELTSAEIYVLNGLLPGTEQIYASKGLKPVITSQTQLFSWIRYCDAHAWTLGAALHIDTGINRLGFRMDELTTLAALSTVDLGYFDLVMSHLACADDLAHPRNGKQIEAFIAARRALAVIPSASLAATGGCFLGGEAHFDLVRPGIGLFGGNPFSNRPSPFNSVAMACAPLLQVKLHRKGEHIGYGSDHRLQADSLVGAVSVGYADGLPRNASERRVLFHYQGRPLPILGRVSMDLTMVDLSSVNDLSPRPGDHIEIYGPTRCLNAFANDLGTIPNEVLTSFSQRASRRISVIG
jgi:alanine racemase